MATYLSRTRTATPEDLAAVAGWLLSAHATFTVLLKNAREAHAEELSLCGDEPEHAEPFALKLNEKNAESIVRNLAQCTALLGYERVEGATDEAVA